MSNFMFILQMSLQKYGLLYTLKKLPFLLQARSKMNALDKAVRELTQEVNHE